VTSTEWRVTYRRSAWKASTGDQARVFKSEHAARRFAMRLLAGRPDLSPVSRVRISRRQVGPWEPERVSIG
jgi:hypothetical protein